MNHKDMASYPNSDQLFQWMIEKLSGTINGSDEQELNYLIETNPEVRRTWLNIQEQFSIEDKESLLERFSEDEYWTAAQIRKPLPWREEKVFPLRRIMSIAAILTSCLLGGYLLYLQFVKSRPEPLAESKSSVAVKASIQLQLAGGETIDLSNAEGNVKAGNVTLQPTAKSLSYGQSSDKAENMASMNILTVPVGLDYKVALSDGTEIWLNSSTQLRFPFSFSADSREVAISGEAYLKVAKDPKRPFIVHTPKSSIQVLGTDFNINTYESGIVRVALVQGSVRVNTALKKMKIRPGQQAIFDTTKGNLEVQPFDRETVLSWRDGIHYFDNSTLEEICKVFPRWFGVEIKLDNSTIARKRFTGVLDRKKPVIEFIQALKTTAALDYYTDENGVIHLK